MEDWHNTHAPKGGILGINGQVYRGGTYVPFYAPRPKMPQIDEADYPGLLEFATERGVTWRAMTYDPPGFICPHQRIDHDRARHMSEENLIKPILSTADRFVLDGHHRWFEHVIRGRPVKAIEFELDFLDALHFLFSYPKTYSFEQLADSSVERV